MKYLKRILQIPEEILKALTRILSYFYIIIYRFLEKLIEELSGKKKGSKKKIHCYEVPIHIRRKPDPCIYSQHYIHTHFPNIQITWDNPDIWFTETDGTPANSKELLPDHNYIVHVQIHNASFDPSIRTSVRCFYRPFGFTWDEHLPVETNADGSEKVVMLHIGAWGSSIAKFNWLTPMGSGHLCLRGECSHVDDRNPENNIGQENVRIIDVDAGNRREVSASILNKSEKEELKVFFKADTYVIRDKNIELNLETFSQSFSNHSFFPKWNNKVNNFRFGRKPGPVFTGYQYKGLNNVLKFHSPSDNNIPSGLVILMDSLPLHENVILAALEKKTINIEVHVPPGAEIGKMSININAFNAKTFQLIGGITIFTNIH